jgi:hypothetical protein
MTEDQGRAEYQEMTIDTKGKYESWPRSKFNERRKSLFEKFIQPKMAKEEEAKKEEGRAWLEKENEKIAEREDQEISRKVQDINIKFFGSQKEYDQVLGAAVETIKSLSEENRNFLDTEIPKTKFLHGDNPLVLSLLAAIRKEPDLIEGLNLVGLEKLVKLFNKLPISWRRRR